MSESLINILSGEKRPAAMVTRVALLPAALAYRAVIHARAHLFDWHLRPARRLDRPVISVGNLTTGGTGKTPMVIELSRRLIALGATPAVLLRGYMAGAAGSDEATLLKQALGDGVAVEADADRRAAAQRVLKRAPATSVFILDDGFQHRQIARDIDLVLIDATRPFGFGHMLPRGLLREPARALRRATAVIVTRSDQVTRHELEQIDARIASLTGRPPIAHAVHAWRGWMANVSRNPGAVHRTDLPLDTLHQARVVAAAGIGNPSPFYATLRQHVGEVLHEQTFDDHHRYTAAELSALMESAVARGADALVTTQKDWVKWKPLLRAGRPELPIYHPVLAIAFIDGEEMVDNLLRSVVAPGK